MLVLLVTAVPFALRAARPRGGSRRVSALSPARARALVSAMRGRRVLVVGDVMLDEFLWGRVSRISPEAPVPVVQVERESFHVGGAGNVAANVRALGGAAALVGVVGEDAAGARVREALAARRDRAAPRDAEPARPTTVKTRIVAHHQQVVRADREDGSDVAGERRRRAARRACARSCRAAARSSCPTTRRASSPPRSCRALLPLARRCRVPVLVDPKVRHFALYRGVALVTPNQLEAEQATGVRIGDARSAEKAGRAILRSARLPGGARDARRARHEPLRARPAAAARPGGGARGLRRDGRRRHGDRDDGARAWRRARRSPRRPSSRTRRPVSSSASSAPPRSRLRSCWPRFHEQGGCCVAPPLNPRSPRRSESALLAAWCSSAKVLRRTPLDSPLAAAE